MLPLLSLLPWRRGFTHVDCKEVLQIQVSIYTNGVKVSSMPAGPEQYREDTGQSTREFLGFDTLIYINFVHISLGLLAEQTLLANNFYILTMT